MDATTTPAGSKYSSFLPYWAVFQADCKQTICSWIYRTWVVVTMGAAIGYLTYRFGAKGVGIIQPGPEIVADFLKWVLFGNVTLIIVLTAGAICSDYGSMADSVLSRGISRYQYFLGKWTARLSVVLFTFLFMAGFALAGAYFLLHSEHLDLRGSLVGLLTVGVFLVGVITCGVTVSALTNNAMLSIFIVWVALYGGGFVLSLLPGSFPSPDRALHNLPYILQGYYDWHVLGRAMAGCLGVSLAAAIVGMVLFSRRDV